LPFGAKREFAAPPAPASPDNDRFTGSTTLRLKIGNNDGFFVCCKNIQHLERAEFGEKQTTQPIA
jgi:hypothetical protein